MEYGEIPKEWKQANVSPLFKKGQKHLAENYRPVNLTSIVCKLMETFIKRELMTHLINLNLLSPMQWLYLWPFKKNVAAQLPGQVHRGNSEWRSGRFYLPGFCQGIR